MKVGELTRINEAPQSGLILAYTVKEVIFQQYDSLSKILSMDGLKNSRLLEIHLFDNKKEYRAVETEEKRTFSGSAPGTIEYVIAEKEGEDVLEEKILLEGEFLKTAGTLTVKNYLSFNPDNGMAVINDYRLVSEV